MLALLKRNFILYFRNRSGVFFSLLGALISFLLYIIFLQKNLTDSWSQLPDNTNLLNDWLMGGTLAVTGMTTSFTALTQMVQDRENQVDQDLFLTDLGNWGLQASYLISSIVISFIMQVFMYAVMSFYFKESPVISHLPEIALIMLLSSLLSSLVNVLLIYRFQSVDSLGKLATIVGTASGFLVGTYIPIGVLPDSAQLFMKCTDVYKRQKKSFLTELLSVEAIQLSANQCANGCSKSLPMQSACSMTWMSWIGQSLSRICNATGSGNQLVPM